jgi:hypothetical protein
MKGDIVKRAFISSALLLACLWVLLLPQSALASQLIVNCDNPKAKYHSINDALSVLDPHDTNTLLISGTCNESVTVDGFTHFDPGGQSHRDPHWDCIRHPVHHLFT